MNTEYEDLEGTCIVATTRALRIAFDGVADPVWAPRSVVEDGEDKVKSDEDFRVARWFALQEGLI